MSEAATCKAFLNTRFPKPSRDPFHWCLCHGEHWVIPPLAHRCLQRKSCRQAGETPRIPDPHLDACSSRPTKPLPLAVRSRGGPKRRRYIYSSVFGSHCEYVSRTEPRLAPQTRCWSFSQRFMLEYNALDAGFPLDSLLSLPSSVWALTLGQFPQSCAKFDNFTKILEHRWFEHPRWNRTQWWRPQDRAQFHGNMTVHDINIMLSERSARDQRKEASLQVSRADIGYAALAKLRKAPSLSPFRPTRDHLTLLPLP